jgi:hypothetical protein
MKFKRIIVFSLLLISNFVKASETYQATTQLNIRSGAGTNYGVVGSIAQGDKVFIDTIVSGWGQVLVNGQPKGFAAIKYLTTDFKDYAVSSKTDNKKKSPWTSILSILFLLVIGYFQFFGKSSSKSKSSPATKRQEKVVNHFLEIRNGNVLHCKEGSTGFNTVYSGGDAIDFDLEYSHEERSRFLVVTSRGNVLLCKTHSTGIEFVYREFVSFGHAHKASFADSNSFIFHTDKGAFKGYFNSTRKDRLK